MQIVLIVIYCLTAGLMLFGLTFHDGLIDERRRKQKIARSLIVIEGGKSKLRRV